MQQDNGPSPQAEGHSSHNPARGASTPPILARDRPENTALSQADRCLVTAQVHLPERRAKKARWFSADLRNCPHPLADFNLRPLRGEEPMAPMTPGVVPEVVPPGSDLPSQLRIA